MLKENKQETEKFFESIDDVSPTSDQKIASKKNSSLNSGQKFKNCPKQNKNKLDMKEFRENDEKVDFNSMNDKI